MRDGPEAGPTHIDAVFGHGEFASYYLAHSASADTCRRLGRTAEARSSYEKALALTQQEPERQFLQARIRQLKKECPVAHHWGNAESVPSVPTFRHSTQGPAHRDEAAINGAQLPISCSRHRSAVFTPASCCFKIPMICSSVYRLFFILSSRSDYERTPASTGRVFRGQVIVLFDSVMCMCSGFLEINNPSRLHWRLQPHSPFPICIFKLFHVCIHVIPSVDKHEA